MPKSAIEVSKDDALEYYKVSRKCYDNRATLIELFSGADEVWNDLENSDVQYVVKDVLHPSEMCDSMGCGC